MLSACCDSFPYLGFPILALSNTKLALRAFYGSRLALSAFGYVASDPAAYGPDEAPGAGADLTELIR
jgi:hypothetical protein